MWRDVTEADVLGVLNASELAAYKTAVAGRGQNVLADALRGVVEQCRGYIADFAGNALAAGQTLPERVILSAMHIVRVEMMTRLNLEISKERLAAKVDAIRFFEGVAAGRFAVEQPTGPVDESGGTSSMETLVSRERIAGRQSLKGL